MSIEHMIIDGRCMMEIQKLAPDQNNLEEKSLMVDNASVQPGSNRIFPKVVMTIFCIIGLLIQFMFCTFLLMDTNQTIMSLVTGIGLIAGVLGLILFLSQFFKDRTEQRSRKITVVGLFLYFAPIEIIILIIVYSIVRYVLAGGNQHYENQIPPELRTNWVGQK